MKAWIDLKMLDEGHRASSRYVRGRAILVETTVVRSPVVVQIGENHKPSMLESAPIEPKVRPWPVVPGCRQAARASSEIVRPRQAIFPALAILSIHRQLRPARIPTGVLKDFIGRDLLPCAQRACDLSAPAGDR